MALTIRDAVQANLKARIGLIAPAKAGKTFTMLTFLFGMKSLGMASRIGVIDTEHRSASKYKRDFGPFRVIEMEDNFSPEQYILALEMLAADGCDAVGIDSLSHAWAGKGGALEMKDKFARQREFNDWTAWGPVTALHIRMIEAMLSYPGHLIATMRSKMEYVMEQDPITKKNVVRKVGLQPLQRDGMEFEFDIIGDINQDHELTITGTRCRALDGYQKTKPGPEPMKTLKAWLESDEAVQAKASPPSTPAPVALPPATAPESGKENPPGVPMPKASESLAKQIADADSLAKLQAIAPVVGAAHKAGHVDDGERKALLEAYLARERTFRQGAAA